MSISLYKEAVTLKGKKCGRVPQGPPAMEGVPWALCNPIPATGWAKKLGPWVTSSVRQ